jgi:hypothetical protein
MTVGSKMYENYKLCHSLESKQICIVLEQYDQGKFKRRFHQHIPKSRMSEQSRSELLKAFIVKYSGFSPEAIVSAYINDRGRNPTHSNRFQFHTTHPEPGVLRHYCGTNTKAWIDQVIQPSKFRQDK